VAAWDNLILKAISDNDSLVRFRELRHAKMWCTCRRLHSEDGG
jgi:hypothetical protein